MTRLLLQQRAAGWRAEPAPQAPTTFHRACEGYEPSPLVSLASLAETFQVGRLLVKEETARFGLSSFKILGASWATVEALRPLLPGSWKPEHGLACLRGAVAPVVLVAATDGNHGHALARVAGILGVASRIYVPESIEQVFVDRIAGEGAEVVRVAGTYDDAVRRSAEAGEREGFVVVSDTSWPGYERIPGAVIDGYSTILRELDDQLAERDEPTPDVVLVQLGVGAFGAAVIRHFRAGGSASPVILGVEPTTAACVMASLAAGKRVTVPGPHDSIMSGLNCGTPSLIAWPLLRDGLDGVVALDDDHAVEGVRLFGQHGLSAGECAGVALAAARELFAGPSAPRYRSALALPPRPSVLLFATEAATGAAARAAPGEPDGVESLIEQ